jgi:thiol-disulfide isomerase/thioredoxin
MLPERPYAGPSRRSWLAAGLGTWLLPVAAQPATPAAAERVVPLPALGSALPLPDIPLLDGKLFQAQAADGQLLVLYWWASWCPFCAQQTPLMNQLWLNHRGRGLQLLGLSIDRRPEDASAYLARRGYSFPSGWVTPAVAKALPKPKGLPVSIVRSRDARVLAAEAGQLFPEDVEQFARFL